MTDAFNEQPQHDDPADPIVALVAQIAAMDGSLQELMQSAIGFFEAELGADAAERLREADFQDDEAILLEWGQWLLETEPPPADTEAFYVGTYDGLDDAEESSEWVAYLSGSNEFDPDDSYCDWASNQTYFSDHCRVNLPVSNGWSRVAMSIAAAIEDAPFPGVDYALQMCWITAIAKTLCSNTDPALWLRGDKTSHPVAVGHDSGDAYLIGSITSRGFEPAGR